MNRLSGWSVQVIGEANSKEQLNNVHPQTLIQHMRDVAACGMAAKATPLARHTLGWSIHKEIKKLDRVGEKKKSKFDFLSMDCLIELVEFSLLNHNAILAAGEPWRRGGTIPMGVPSTHSRQTFIVCERAKSL